METGFPEVALGVVRNSSGQVLIVKRKDSEQGTGGATLKWAFPGGEIDKGRTPRGAAERTVREETGYEVEGGETISEREHPEFPAYVYYVSCRLVTDGSPDRPGDNIEEIKWVSPADLPEYFTSDLDQEVQNYLSSDREAMFA